MTKWQKCHLLHSCIGRLISMTKRLKVNHKCITSFSPTFRFLALSFCNASWKSSRAMYSLSVNFAAWVSSKMSASLPTTDHALFVHNDACRVTTLQTMWNSPTTVREIPEFAALLRDTRHVMCYSYHACTYLPTYYIPLDTNMQLTIKNLGNISLTRPFFIWA